MPAPRPVRTLVAVAALALPAVAAFATDPPSTASVERGRYVVMTSGCNDCHTAGYMATAGHVPQTEWLKGDSLGWRGPWGTTFAPNIRILFSKLTEDDWVVYARSVELRPPMPWFGLREMTEADLRSIYRFTRSLGAPGEPAPPFLEPGVEPAGPYFMFHAPAGPAVAQQVN